MGVILPFCLMQVTLQLKYSIKLQGRHKAIHRVQRKAMKHDRGLENMATKEVFEVVKSWKEVEKIS